MDKITKAANIIVAINQFKNQEIKDHELISMVCSYFDEIKTNILSESDKQFLYYIANEVGIPQYFDTLLSFNKSATIQHFNLSTICDICKEATLYTSVDSKLHKYQKDILDNFKFDKQNRYFLSASTSFGKTFLVYEIIRKMKYRNILLVFPSIALLSENLEKIISDERYCWIRDNYTIHTMSMIDNVGENNLCIYTPERYLSFLDTSVKISFDFVFVDEVYKIDNSYIIDEVVQENERDIAYRLALHYMLQSFSDVFLVGPYIEFSSSGSTQYNPSFDIFLEENNIILLNYNSYEIVNKEYRALPHSSKQERFKKQIHECTRRNENIIVYCSRRSDTEKYATYLIDDESVLSINTEPFEDFLYHLSTIFYNSSDWIIVKALKKGIGIHHGLIPKYIQKEIINLYNKGYITILLSTTTITEGVNTTAKNILVMSSKKGNKPLKKFDALNIEGRAGRFLQHYKGIVYSLDKRFETIKNSIGDPIKHKNYDTRAPKDDIDLFFTDTKYLNETNTKRKQVIEQLQTQYDIPESIINQFKVISREDKIKLYDYICHLSSREFLSIRNLIQCYQSSRQISYDGIEVIINVVLPIVHNENLRTLMTRQQPEKTTKILTVLLYAYFRYGLIGMINHKIANGEGIQKSVSMTTSFVYNTVKYQIVKYFGAFNLMYKFYLSKKENKPFEQITGIDAILLKMEYNANSEIGRIVSDYGVPQKVLEYYELDKNKRREFDMYEERVFEKTEKILKRNK